MDTTEEEAISMEPTHRLSRKVLRFTPVPLHPLPCPPLDSSRPIDGTDQLLLRIRIREAHEVPEVRISSEVGREHWLWQGGSCGCTGLGRKRVFAEVYALINWMMLFTTRF